jgi:phosphoribosylamine--glycine ligase
MAKFLLMSLKGDGLGFALRLRAAGHEVKARIVGKTERQNYEGLIDKIDKWDDHLAKDTIVVFDSTGGGSTADRLRARGHFVFLGSVFADNLELDRELAFELMAQAGIKVPEFKTFYSWEEGRAYVNKHAGKLVFKPTGKFSDEHGVGSYVSCDKLDMLTMLDYFESISRKSPEFIFQNFVEGIAVSTEGWFNGYEWMEPFNHTIEHKAVMNEDLGPSSGCAFNVVWAVRQTNRVIEEGIKLMAPLLRDYNYVGPVDLNTVVNEEGVWALEFTPRFGYDAFPSLLELVDGDLGEIVAKMARGEQPDEIPLKAGYASAVRVSIPPHPSDEFVHPGGIPIQGLTRSDRPHLYFFEVMLDARDRLVSTRGGGAIAAVTGLGDSIEGSFREPYEICKRMRIPEKQYRTDAVAELSADYAELYRQLAVGHNQLKFVGGNP